MRPTSPSRIGIRRSGMRVFLAAIAFGLAGCDGVERITVRWPDAQNTTETWERLPANTFVKLEQGSPTPFVVRLGQ